MQIFLETDRLILRRFTEDDVDLVYELNTDPDVTRFITGGIPTPFAVVRDEILPYWKSLYEQYEGFGYFAAIDRATGDFLGWFLFRPNKKPLRADGSYREGVELGYRLRRSAWGQGYATEGSRALIAKGFTALGVERVYAEAMAVHAASRRVMEKAGLRFIGPRRDDWPDPVPGDELGDVEYALTKSEWMASQPG